MPTDVKNRLSLVVRERFDKCVSKLLRSGFASVHKREERAALYIKIIIEQHAYLDTFDSLAIERDCVDIKVVVTFEHASTTGFAFNYVVTVGNLYTFILLCGETPKPWNWIPENKEYQGELGLYQERDTCCTLKRRNSSTINKAKIDKHELNNL